MKNPIPQLFALSIVLLIVVQGCNRCPKNLYENYEQDQLIVIYKKAPTPEVKEKIREAIKSNDVEIDTIQECNQCGVYAELWHGEDIHSTIHAEGVSAGSGLRHNNVGEDTVARYMVNYKIPLPFDTFDHNGDIKGDENDSLVAMSLQNAINTLEQRISGQGRDTIIIAVLDTGFDPQGRLDSPFLWSNQNNDQDCYPVDSYGWNFIDDDKNIRDDNKPHWHGTFVSLFIINEFLQSPHNFPQIMSLKTHDASGSGSLFKSICAIHYAMAKGANIINASWGFYDNEILGHPYLDSLITEALRQKGILFVTAAGNKIDEVDTDLKNDGVASVNLRDIKYNHFYPARLNNINSNNVFTVTTNSSTDISPTQNYSSHYVDVGVMADVIGANSMQFTLPNINRMVSGSSYATAIFSGKIGAHIDKSICQPNISKITVLSNLQAHISGAPALNGKIRKGKYVKKWQ